MRIVVFPRRVAAEHGFVLLLDMRRAVGIAGIVGGWLGLRGSRGFNESLPTPRLACDRQAIGPRRRLRHDREELRLAVHALGDFGYRLVVDMGDDLKAGRL